MTYQYPILLFLTLSLNSLLLAQVPVFENRSASSGNFRNAAIWDQSYYPGGPGDSFSLLSTLLPPARGIAVVSISLGHIITLQPDSWYTSRSMAVPAMPSSQNSTDSLSIIITRGVLNLNRDIIIERINLTANRAQLNIASNTTLTADDLILTSGATANINGNLILRWRPDTSYHPSSTAFFTRIFQIDANSPGNFNDINIDFLDGIRLDIASSNNISATAGASGIENMRFRGSIPSGNINNVNNWGQEIVDFGSGFIKNIEFNYQPSSMVNFNNRTLTIRGNLILRNQSSLNLTNNSTFNITGSLIMEDSSRLRLNNSALNIAGDLRIGPSARFEYDGTSTVNLNGPTGSTQNLAGDIDFYDLNIINNGARTVNFERDKVYHVRNEFSAQGADTSNRLTLTGGQRWRLRLERQGVFQYLAVRNGDASLSSPGVLPLLGDNPTPEHQNLGGNVAWFPSDPVTPPDPTSVYSNLSEAKVAPSIFRPNRDPYIRFQGLPNNTTVSVYSIAGRKIFERVVSSQLDWDGRTSSNLSLGSGVYVVHLLTEDGSSKVVKFVVIR